MPDTIINNLVNEARALGCSEIIINNLLVAGDFQAMCQLEEVVEAKKYLARETERKGLIEYNHLTIL